MLSGQQIHYETRKLLYRWNRSALQVTWTEGDKGP